MLTFQANSIEGNKKDNINIIYTPWANLKKTGAMAVGEVSFHDSREVRRELVDLSTRNLSTVVSQVKRILVPKRENAIVNRLVKTKASKVVDHEAERAQRITKEAQARRAAALAKVSVIAFCPCRVPWFAEHVCICAPFRKKRRTKKKSDEQMNELPRAMILFLQIKRQSQRISRPRP